jgi:hypothetical protein
MTYARADSEGRADVRGSPFGLLIEWKRSMCAKAWMPVETGYAVFLRKQCGHRTIQGCGCGDRAVASAVVEEVD